MTSSVALACAQTTGFPPKVLKWIFRAIVAAMAGVVTTAAIGHPLPIPLARVTMSGITPCVSKSPKMRAGPAETGLDFIGNRHPAGDTDMFVCVLEIAIGKTITPPTP